MHFTPPPLARHNIQRNLATRTTAVPRGASVLNHAERDETTTTMGEVLPSTDPYATREEPDPDRLLAKSTTPLMSGGASGIIRICILLGIAVFIIHGKSNAKPVATDTEYGGLRFPHEIKIAGSRQNVLGGGPTPFGALAVYVRMTPDQVTSPPSAEWAELDAYADRRHVESDGGFFHALGSLKLDKSILLQLDGRRDAATFVGELGASLEAAFNGNGAGAKVVEALTSAITDSLPAAGAQLYMTCDRKNVHVAYGFPADGKRVRDTAPVTASLAHAEYPGVCTTLFRAFLGTFGAGTDDAGAAHSSVREGVARGFMEQYGRSDPSTAHDEL